MVRSGHSEPARQLRVGLHADGGAGVGLGHVSRVSGLAQALGRRGVDTRVFAAHGAGVEPLDAPIHWLEGPPVSGEALLDAVRQARCDALVIDSYRLSENDLKRLGDALHVACFDDGVLEPVPAGLVINAAAGASHRYASEDGRRLLLGPAYQILRPGFDQVAPVRSHRDRVSRVLVTLGASAPPDITRDVAVLVSAWMSAQDPGAEVDVVVGPFAANPFAEASIDRLRLHSAPENLRALMLHSDLAVSAGGQTLYELAACGTPTIAVCVSDDQRGNLQLLAAHGAIEEGGRIGSGDWRGELAAALERCQSRAGRDRLSDMARRVVDGQGAARVAEAIEDWLLDRR
jgi:UDP-2,4-diacetamido-2,4,6-trideoxy-beta-L-altropyranose hydrolase